LIRRQFDRIHPIHDLEVSVSELLQELAEVRCQHRMARPGDRAKKTIRPSVGMNP